MKKTTNLLKRVILEYEAIKSGHDNDTKNVKKKSLHQNLSETNKSYY